MYSSAASGFKLESSKKQKASQKGESRNLDYTWGAVALAAVLNSSVLDSQGLYNASVIQSSYD